MFLEITLKISSLIALLPCARYPLIYQKLWSYFRCNIKGTFLNVSVLMFSHLSRQIGSLMRTCIPKKIQLANGLTEFIFKWNRYISNKNKNSLKLITKFCTSCITINHYVLKWMTKYYFKKICEIILNRLFKNGKTRNSGSHRLFIKEVEKILKFIPKYWIYLLTILLLKELVLINLQNLNIVVEAVDNPRIVICLNSWSTSASTAHC